MLLPYKEDTIHINSVCGILYADNKGIVFKLGSICNLYCLICRDK